MPKEISPIGQAAIDLLETKDWNFEHQPVQAAHAQMAAQEALDTGLETRVMLGNEADALIKTMYWLDRHTFLGRLAGNRGLIQHRELGIGDLSSGLTTTPIFASRPEYIEDGKQSEYVSDYYVFTVNYRNMITDPLLFKEMPREVLTIARCMVGAESGIRKPIEYWAVSLRRDWQTDEVAEVGFSSTQTDDYKNKSQEKIFEKYVREHPLIKDYWNASEDSEQPLVVKKPFYMLPGWREPIDGDDVPELSKPHPIANASAIKQLRRELTRGVGWDYSDNDYLFPLGLITQARAEFEKGQIRSKLLK